VSVGQQVLADVLQLACVEKLLEDVRTRAVEQEE
jgi:hypothetical protein